MKKYKREVTGAPFAAVDITLPFDRTRQFSIFSCHEARGKSSYVKYLKLRT